MYGVRVGMMWPKSCSIITEQPSSNNEASSLLVLFAICLSLPGTQPNTWREGQLIDPLSISTNGRANPEHKIANLKSMSPFSLPFCAQSKAAIAAPCENPRIPSNGPSRENTFFKYDNDTSNPSVCCRYWRGSNGLSAFFQSVALLPLESGAINHENFPLQVSVGGRICCDENDNSSLHSSSETHGWYMKGNSWGASTKTSSAMFLSFLANDAVLPLKPDAFCRNPCKHKILSFLGGLAPVLLDEQLH